MLVDASVIKQWAFTPPSGYEASLFAVLLIIGATTAAVLVGVWAYKRKTRSSKVHSKT